jgi:hypothetical protein
VAFQMRSVVAAIDEGRFAEGELPQNYSVAYQLVTLAEQEIEVAREKKIIRPDVRRAEVIAFKRSLRPPRSVTARHEKGLCAERERLLARLREIDILLSRKTIEATEFTVLQELDDEEGAESLPVMTLLAQVRHLVLSAFAASCRQAWAYLP